MKRKELPKLPRVELACGNQDIRPAFNYISVQKEFTYATDAHILVRLKTAELFPETFAKSIPDEGIFIHKNAFKLMHRNKYQLSEDKKMIQVTQKDGSIINYDCKPDIKFPSYDQLIPNIKDAKPLHEIALKPSLLNRMAQALCIYEGTSILHLYFYDVTKQILCVPNNRDEYNFNAVGIIMPCILN